MTNHLARPDTVVRVNGQVQRSADVVIHGRIAAETDSPHTGTHGVVTTSCDITWMPTSSRPDHPWLPGWFAPDGAEVTVDLEWDDRTSRRFTGNVVSSHFDVGTGTVTSRCAGREEWLARQGSFPPLAYKLGPWEDGADVRNVGMSSAFVTGWLMRQAGFTAVAPTDDRTAVFLPMEGSAWAEVGQTRAAHSVSRGQGLAPYAVSTAWGGVALENPYVFARGAVSGSSGSPLSLVVDLGDRASLGADEATILVTDTTDTAGIGFEIDGNNLYMLSVESGTPTRRGSLTRTDGMTRVQVVYDGANLELLADDLASGESFPSWTGSISLSYSAVHVLVDAAVAHVGAVQARRSADSLVYAPRTLRHRRDVFDMSVNGGVGAMPAVRDRDILDVLSEQVQSEWLDFWVDEHGVAQVCDRDVLESQAPVKVVTDAWLGGLLDLPQNGFRSLPDGTPTPDRAAPTSTSGITAFTDTLIAATSDASGPYLYTVNAGSSASPGQRGVYMLVPIREGERNSFYAETRSVYGVQGRLRARYYGSSGPILDSPQVSGTPAGGTGGWTQVMVELPEAPVGATYARVEAVNGSTMAFSDELHFRNFTTYGPGVMLKALSARTPGVGSYGRVVVNRRTVPPMPVRQKATIPLWDGGVENLSPGDEYVKFATPAARDDYQVHWPVESIDLDWEWAGDPGGTPLNRREGSVFGGQVVDTSDDSVIRWVDEGDWDPPFTVEFIHDEKVLITGTVKDPIPGGGGREIETVPLQTSPSVSNTRKNGSTMRLYGYAAFTTVTGEPVIRDLATTGPDYVHDGGIWLQSDYQAGQVADKLRDWIENPRPVIDSLEIPLTDVNRGDRVIVHLTNIAGVTLDVKVIGIDENHAAGAMSLTAQVLDAEVTSLTLAQIPDLDEFLSA